MKKNEYMNSPLWNSALSLKERLDFLISDLSIEEKILLVSGNMDVPRLGIDVSCLGGEAAHGIEARRDQAFNAGEPIPTTSFVQPIGMSATWDTELLEEIGTAVGNEARIIHADDRSSGLCRWAPTIDMLRDPRWGRTEEAYGEDPYLTGKMSSAYIRGMRGSDPFYIRAGATLKHFYANNVEQDRIKISSSIDPRNKWEYYLEPFKRAVMEGKAEGIMTAYNEINGVPCIVLDEVQKIVKDTWGLKGHVVCDGGDMIQTVYDHQYYGSHAKTVAEGLKAGVDSFSDDRHVVKKALEEAYECNWISEIELNRSIRNTFSTRIRLGLFDGVQKSPYAHIPKELMNSIKHQELSLKSAQEAIVLLQNDEILPLKKEEKKTIAVIGPLANVWYKDWYCGIPPYQVTLLEGLKNAAPANSIVYTDGLDRIQITSEGKYLGIDANECACMTDKENAVTFVLTDWGYDSNTLYAEGFNKFLTADDDNNLILANKSEAFGWFIKEAFHIKALNNGKYKLDTWNNRAIIVASDGHISISDDKNHTSFTIECISNGLAVAKEMAAKCDKVILAMGSNPVINSKEEIDRKDLKLPPAHEKMIKGIYEVNPNCILVLITNYPYAINWEKEHLPAILWSASGSQELGNGIASALFGDISPAGRLNMTWYPSHTCLPDMQDYDIITGKRTYQYYDNQVLYPFGHGLTYTTFSYSDMSVEVKDYTTVIVQCNIKNTGAYQSDEVVQLYIRHKDSRVIRPNLQLKSFNRMKQLDPQERIAIRFEVPLEDLKYYDVVTQSMVLEEGQYLFMLGSSSADIRLQEEVKIQGEIIGTRNFLKRTSADLYDSYRNIYLHRGNRGYTCVLPKDPDKEGILVYEDVEFDSDIKHIEMDIYAEEDGELAIYMDDTLVGSFKCKKNTMFTDAVIPLVNIPIAKRCIMKIVIHGNIKISSFIVG